MLITEHERTHVNIQVRRRHGRSSPMPPPLTRSGCATRTMNTSTPGGRSKGGGGAEGGQRGEKGGRKKLGYLYQKLRFDYESIYEIELRRNNETSSRASPGSLDLCIVVLQALHLHTPRPARRVIRDPCTMKTFESHVSSHPQRGRCTSTASAWLHGLPR